MTVKWIVVIAIMVFFASDRPVLPQQSGTWESEARSRREEWFALAAYQKVADRQVPEDHPVSF